MAAALARSGSSFAAPTVVDRSPSSSTFSHTLRRGGRCACQENRRRSGEKGVDEVFGHGALNLERAVQAVGVASLPTGKNIRAGWCGLAVRSLVSAARSAMRSARLRPSGKASSWMSSAGRSRPTSASRWWLEIAASISRACLALGHRDRDLRQS